ncbi:hypothetical protein CGCF413_v014901 [Colletotrichum fructicola]|nr:hypothetical protein CGCF413_v014901 [Colletotrichum fructicola]
MARKDGEVRRSHPAYSLAVDRGPEIVFLPVLPSSVRCGNSFSCPLGSQAGLAALDTCGLMSLRRLRLVLFCDHGLDSRNHMTRRSGQSVNVVKGGDKKDKKHQSCAQPYVTVP